MQEKKGFFRRKEHFLPTVFPSGRKNKKTVRFIKKNPKTGDEKIEEIKRKNKKTKVLRSIFEKSEKGT